MATSFTIHSFAPSKENKIDSYIYKMPIEGLWYVEHKLFDDNRGFYSELGRIPEIEAVRGEHFQIQQLNLSHSKKHVIRGFHAENWNKLLTVTQGLVFAAWLDVRPESETFGQSVTMEVGKDNGTPWGSVFVSRGIANSFCALSASVDYMYAVDQLYANRDTSGDVAINLFDKDVGINWPVSRDQLIISERDTAAVSLREKFPEKF